MENMQNPPAAIQETGGRDYSITDNSTTMMTILKMIEMELIALAKPASSPMSAVNAGTMVEMGLNNKITRV